MIEQIEIYVTQSHFVTNNIKLRVTLLRTVTRNNVTHHTVSTLMKLALEGKLITLICGNSVKLPNKAFLSKFQKAGAERSLNNYKIDKERPFICLTVIILNLQWRP